MAMIAIDNAYLPGAHSDIKRRFVQRVRKQIRAFLFDRNKRNRSPFPDRVWARHSALLHAARISHHDNTSL